MTYKRNITLSLRLTLDFLTMTPRCPFQTDCQLAHIEGERERQSSATTSEVFTEQFIRVLCSTDSQVVLKQN